MNKLNFTNDYSEGAHPEILRRLTETNMEKCEGYGLDSYCKSAKDKIRAAAEAPDAEIYFLTGGTQTNAVVISAVLRPYQGVISADTGHIASHEAGAIEAHGHKVICLPHKEGKLLAKDIEQCFIDYQNDPSREHLVMPGMVYISHTTEYGTVYTKDELQKISAVCRKNHAPLFLDGARLGYALAARNTDVTLKTIANYCDIFYIGGTKVGAFLGEAFVITKEGFIPHFFSIMKQQGALLAKGRLLGVQFDTLFTNNLYFEISAHAVKMAEKLKTGLSQKGHKFLFDAPANQLFLILEKSRVKDLSEKIGWTFWGTYDENNVVMRLTASWATKSEDVENAIALL
ncbi:MAG: aminotransferase class V-fold PLP-dependent enzyme [Spirochaetaceae bacterium]|jgi:threonine aldolase|nr:aminotransferase class V-fold PLP-dependent enzyme [Spirochaetaceae bacterium]